MLEVRHLCAHYSGLPVLHDISFTVQRGEWLMITGPNGAGKSTLLSALLESIPHTGDVLLEGRHLQTLKPRERARRMGLLNQRVATGYDFTVEEIVRLGRYAHHDALGGFHTEDEAAVERALTDTGTLQLRSHPISQVSGGEAQRAFLAQLFAQNPKLLLLDEPSSHLDLSYQKQVFELIQGWLRHEDRAVVSVVHDLSIARKFGTRVILLDHGHIAADAVPQEALSPALLKRVYGMDVTGWMRDMYAGWADAADSKVNAD